MGLYVEITAVNADRGCRYSKDSFETDAETKGELYRLMVKEYGRCTSKVYIDRKDGTAQEVGWVFTKRQKYDDCNETFLSETWVTALKSAPRTIRQYDYA